MASRPVDYAALDEYLDLYREKTEKLVKSDFASIERNMFTAARCCTCWNHRRPTSEADRDAYLEKYLGIGNGDGNTIWTMKGEQQYQEILADMTRTVKNCRCDARLPKEQRFEKKEWPFETTDIYSNDRNEDPNSKMLWKAKATALGYKDPGRSDDWKFDDTRPNITRVHSFDDGLLWPNVFGQAGDAKDAGKSYYYVLLIQQLIICIYSRLRLLRSAQDIRNRERSEQNSYHRRH